MPMIEPACQSNSRRNGWKRFQKNIGDFRNHLAHGSFILVPDGGRTLRVVADIINQFIPKRGLTFAEPDNQFAEARQRSRKRRWVLSRVSSADGRHGRVG